ncbi:MAG: hypothetical protein HY351_00490 [Candidatus Omnitrophica bacterium]|nr:hypothetical protein [Candidatus Omnitrophota bacterium]
MKKLLSLIIASAILLSPVVSYADDATSEKPIQFLNKKGYVDNTNFIKEPATVDWVTGKGRKDGVLEWAVDDNYLKKVPGMFGRGFSNVTFGWADVITHPFRWTKNAPLGLGTAIGLVMGPVVGVLRTTSGAVDVATCWVPFWHGVPMKKQVLGLHDVAHYGTIEDVAQYDHQTKRYFFSKLSDEY